MLPLLRYSSKRFDSSVSLTLKSIKTIHQFTTLVALFQSINQLDSKEFWRIGYEFLKQTDGLLKLIPLSCDIFNETVQLGTNLLNRSYRKVATSIFNIALSSLDGLIRLSPKMEYFICFLTLQLISRIVSLVKRESADIIEVLPRLIAEGIELKDALHSLSVKRSLEGTGEVWRDHLSTEEALVRELYGEEQLYFDPQSSKERFLILDAAVGPEGNFKDIVQQLSERFNVKFCSVWKIEDIKNEIELASQSGKVTGLMLSAHAFKHSEISLDEGATLNKDNIDRSLFDKLDPSCVIVLTGCGVAKKPTSIAYEVADKSQKTTFASKYSIQDVFLMCLNPLSWAFLGSKGWNTTQIEPSS